MTDPKREGPVPGHACTYPPDGFLGTSGNCVTCGQPRPDPVVATLRDIAENFIAANFIGETYPPLAADLKAIAGRLEAIIRGEDDPGPSARTEWGVAYEGEERPGVLFGVRDYDTREDAEAMIAQGFADVLVTRTVAATPWQRVPLEVSA